MPAIAFQHCEYSIQCYRRIIIQFKTLNRTLYFGIFSELERKMGKRSVKENKNAWQLARESAELTREAASELMKYVTEDRIEKIESERSLPHPDEVLAMADAYRMPKLTNIYCTGCCPIGAKTVHDIPEDDLGHIVLALINDLNHLSNQKDKLIEIASDGVVHEYEKEAFDAICERLENLSLRADMLKLWIKNTAMADK